VEVDTDFNYNNREKRATNDYTFTVKEKDNGVVFRCETSNNVGGPLAEEKR
jgi:hypothetical protein